MKVKRLKELNDSKNGSAYFSNKEFHVLINILLKILNSAYTHADDITNYHGLFKIANNVQLSLSIDPARLCNNACHMDKEGTLILKTTRNADGEIKSLHASLPHTRIGLYYFRRAF